MSSDKMFPAGSMYHFYVSTFALQGAESFKVRGGEIYANYDVLIYHNNDAKKYYYTPISNMTTMDVKASGFGEPGLAFSCTVLDDDFPQEKQAIDKVKLTFLADIFDDFAKVWPNVYSTGRSFAPVRRFPFPNAPYKVDRAPVEVAPFVQDTPQPQPQSRAPAYSRAEYSGPSAPSAPFNPKYTPPTSSSYRKPGSVALPSAATVPTMPSTSTGYTAPSIPSVPAMPSVSAIPSIPAVPQMPAVAPVPALDTDHDIQYAPIPHLPTAADAQDGRQRQEPSAAYWPMLDAKAGARPSKSPYDTPVMAPDFLSSDENAPLL